MKRDESTSMISDCLFIQSFLWRDPEERLQLVFGWRPLGRRIVRGPWFSTRVTVGGETHFWYPSGRYPFDDRIQLGLRIVEYALHMFHILLDKRLGTELDFQDLSNEFYGRGSATPSRHKCRYEVTHET